MPKRFQRLTNSGVKCFTQRMIVVCASDNPRSTIISTRSRRLSLWRRYQRTHRIMISRSKCRPSNIPSRPLRLLITGHQFVRLNTLTDSPSLFAPVQLRADHSEWHRDHAHDQETADEACKQNAAFCRRPVLLSRFISNTYQSYLLGHLALLRQNPFLITKKIAATEINVPRCGLWLSCIRRRACQGSVPNINFFTRQVSIKSSCAREKVSY